MITLHTISGGEISVNPQHITTLEQGYDHCHVTLENGRCFDVTESLTEITSYL